MAPIAFHESLSVGSTDDKTLRSGERCSSVLPIETQLERQRRKEGLAATLRIFGKRGFDHYVVSASFLVSFEES